ncbi:MAG TPA: hypothetical protein PK718_08155 [Candidatus Methanofastidiosa archaeon]|mgnify:CR=1 FL=1|nr:hypothetical protein [Candidatus Methanofastidiosa archaeon]HPR42497.1 hypothetical protein [Candidatus Methanofastidiosa archaeon]
MTTVTKIIPGPCGFETTIEAKKVAPGHVYVKVISDCESLRKLNIGIVNAMEDLYGTFEKSKVYNRANECIRHIACPVPSAILKTVEVEADLAVPKDVKIEIVKTEEED